MDKLFQDWINLCEGKKSFDKSHFFSLFQADDNGDFFSEEELRKILDYFDEKDELFLRLNNYFNNQKEETEDIKDFLIHKMESDLLEKRKLITDAELLTIIDQPIEFVDGISFVFNAQQSSWMHHEIISEIEYSMLAAKTLKTPEVYALFEAFYGLSQNYNLVWYLGKPLLDIDINVDNYFDIWKMGGEYAFSNRKNLLGML